MGRDLRLAATACSRTEQSLFRVASFMLAGLAFFWRNRRTGIWKSREPVTMTVEEYWREYARGISGRQTTWPTRKALPEAANLADAGPQCGMPFTKTARAPGDPAACPIPTAALYPGANMQNRPVLRWLAVGRSRHR